MWQERRCNHQRQIVAARNNKARDAAKGMAKHSSKALQKPSPARPQTLQNRGWGGPGEAKFAQDASETTARRSKKPVGHPKGLQDAPGPPPDAPGSPPDPQNCLQILPISLMHFSFLPSAIDICYPRGAGGRGACAIRNHDATRIGDAKWDRIASLYDSAP